MDQFSGSNATGDKRMQRPSLRDAVNDSIDLRTTVEALVVRAREIAESLDGCPEGATVAKEGSMPVTGACIELHASHGVLRRSLAELIGLLERIEAAIHGPDRPAVTVRR